MPTITHSNTKLYFQIHGTGPPLMLLHAGWGTPVNGFKHQIAQLSDQFQLIIPHRRGYGRSSQVQSFGPEFLERAAPDMLALMEKAGLNSAHVWGHSDGAVVGVWMAIMAPDKVRTLVFEGGHHRPKMHQKAGRDIMLLVRERPETLSQKLQERLAVGHGQGYWKQLLWMWTEAWRLLHKWEGDLYHGRLAEITCPTLIIHGGQDPHTPLNEIETLMQQISQAQTLFFPEGGHSLHDDPAYQDKVHTAMLGLLKRK